VAPGLLLAALLSVSGCGGGPTGAATPGTSATRTPGDTQEEAIVTEDDDGRELALQQGDEVSLQLRSAWSWDEPRVTGDAVRLDPVDHLVDPGYAEWLVVAVAPGNAEVDVAGAPACPDPAACPPRTVHLTVQVGG
jgi:predicted secreted protein